MIKPTGKENRGIDGNGTPIERFKNGQGFVMHAQFDIDMVDLGAEDSKRIARALKEIYIFALILRRQAEKKEGNSSSQSWFNS
jgi:hypothetical protein